MNLGKSKLVTIRKDWGQGYIVFRFPVPDTKHLDFVYSMIGRMYLHVFSEPNIVSYGVKLEEDALKIEIPILQGGNEKEDTWIQSTLSHWYLSNDNLSFQFSPINLMVVLSSSVWEEQDCLFLPRHTCIHSGQTATYPPQGLKQELFKND